MQKVLFHVFRLPTVVAMMLHQSTLSRSKPENKLQFHCPHRLCPILSAVLGNRTAWSHTLASTLRHFGSLRLYKHSSSTDKNSSSFSPLWLGGFFFFFFGHAPPSGAERRLRIDRQSCRSVAFDPFQSRKSCPPLPPPPSLTASLCCLFCRPGLGCCSS